MWGILVDSRAPDIQFRSNLPKKTQGYPQFTWNASEPSNFECALDNIENMRRCGGGTSGRWSGVNVPNGPRMLWVRGTDDMKNVGEWKSYKFDVGKENVYG